MKKGLAGVVAVLTGGLMISSIAVAAPLIRVDMDANTAGYQDSIFVNTGDSFTTNIELVLTNSSDSLNAFGFSLWWDTSELNTPSGSDISTVALGADWSDLSYWSITPSYINNFVQVNNTGYSQGPLTGVIASITWTASNPLTNGTADIMPGNFSFMDGSYNGSSDAVTPLFAGGAVSIAPEPISSILFITGGTLLAGRRLLKLG